MQYQPLELNEFHGGITDNFIDAPLHSYEAADNFLITVNRKLYTRPGSQIYDSDNPKVPTLGDVRIGAYINHYENLLTQCAQNLYYVSAGAWATLQGPTGNPVFTQGNAESRVVSSDWNEHTFVTNDDFAPVSKIYIDDSGDLQARTAGLPALANAPTVATSGATGGSKNYIYAFVYFYEYKVGTVTFQDFGAVTQVALQEIVDSPDVSQVNISLIPQLTNGTDYNYDTTELKIKIYRTESNGTILHYLGEVSNGTLVYTDTTADSAIVNNANLYTTGGQLDNDPPPLCKCLHVTDTLGFYGHIKLANGEILSNRVRQSIPEDPDSCPEELYVDLDDSVVAISSAGKTPVVLCENSIYRLDGAFTALGEGLLEKQEIESTVGCVSATSVVQVQRGIVFAGVTGFYFTDGWEVRKLSTHFNTTYKALTLTDEQKRRIYGTFDRDDKRVWWSVQEDAETEINKFFILDTRYGLGIGGEDL